MKKIYSFLLFFLLAGKSYGQDNQIIIMQEPIPYTEQNWFWSGTGNDLEADKIKKYWNQGKRITSRPILMLGGLSRWQKTRV